MENKLILLGNQTPIQMMSFVITEKTGHVLVIDGGNGGDAEHLLDVLRTVTGREKPFVDGWFFTHAHSDHMDAFFWLLENRRDAFDFGAVYECFPSVQYLAGEDRLSAGVTLSTYYRLAASFPERTVRVSVDNEYDFGEAHIKVLYTYNARFKTNRANNSSTVYRLTLGGKTALFLGDLGEEAGDELMTDKPEEIRCDFCQMAHHGQNGVKRAFYEAAAPKNCLWCAPKWLWENDTGGGFDTGPFNTVRTREWMKEIGGVERNYVIMDGDHEIVL